MAFRIPVLVLVLLLSAAFSAQGEQDESPTIDIGIALVDFEFAEGTFKETNKDNFDERIAMVGLEFAEETVPVYNAEGRQVATCRLYVCPPSTDALLTKFQLGFDQVRQLVNAAVKDYLVVVTVDYKKRDCQPVTRLRPTDTQNSEPYYFGDPSLRGNVVDYIWIGDLIDFDYLRINIEVNVNLHDGSKEAMRLAIDLTEYAAECIEDELSSSEQNQGDNVSSQDASIKAG